MPNQSNTFLLPVVSSFLLGVAATLTASFVVSRLNGPKASSSSSSSTRSRNVAVTVDHDSNNTDTDNNTRQIKPTDVLDSPDLDLRLIRKAEAVIQFRSGNLTVVVERATNSFNHSAILRTAEALGIQHVWIVDPAASKDENWEQQQQQQQQQDDDADPEPADNNKNDTAYNKIRDKKNRLLHLSTEEAEQRRQHHLFARNATEWLSIREFETTQECIIALRETGHAIYVTDLSQQAVELTTDDLQRHGRWPLPHKIALVFGTEAVGCSEEILQVADLRVYLPLRGFADSLNLSVAAALVIHHLLTLEPAYVASMTEQERHELREKWYPKLAKQRLLAARDKKKRRKLLSDISRFETLRVQHEQGAYMTESQMSKISKLEEYRKELSELEKKGQLDASSQVVQELIHNPPEPLSDLRRADAHRVTFAGKGVKNKHAEHWKGMAAVQGQPSKTLSTAGFFRDRLAALVDT